MNQGGCLCLTMSDSGDGYDISTIDFDDFDHERPFSRGLSLIHQMCKNVDLSENGSKISVQYGW